MTSSHMWEANTLRPSQPPAGEGFLGAGGRRAGCWSGGRAGPPGWQHVNLLCSHPLPRLPRGSTQRGRPGQQPGLGWGGPRPLWLQTLGKQPLYLRHLPTCKQPCAPWGRSWHMPSAPMSQVRWFRLRDRPAGARGCRPLALSRPAGPWVRAAIPGLRGQVPGKAVGGDGGGAHSKRGGAGSC